MKEKFFLSRILNLFSPLYSIYLKEVFNSCLLIHPNVVRTVDFNLSYVGFNNLGIVAQRLDEKQFVTHFADNNLVDQLTTF